MALDLSSLKKAIGALDYAVKEAHNDDFMDQLTEKKVLFSDNSLYFDL